MSTKDIPENHEPAPLLGLGSSEGLGPLVDAAQAVMRHQWSNSAEAMDALTRLVDVASERAVFDNETRSALFRLAACVRNCDATYRTVNERSMVIAALEHAEAVLRA